MRIHLIFILICIWNISLIELKHFYGGTVTWKPMTKNVTGSTVAIMFTQSYQWKRTWTPSSGGGSTYCDKTTILNRSPKIPVSGDNLLCVSGSCGGYTNIPVDEYCTDFSTVVDSSSGQISTLRTITVGSKFCVAFQSKYWMKVLSTDCTSQSYGRKKRATTLTQTGCFSDSADWSIGCCVDLTIRPEGFINTPPVATIISPMQVPINTLTDIQIPIIDADNDYLLCRWAKNTTTFNECGDVCQMAPGSKLDESTCTVTFNSTGKTVGDFYAIALMVEDFYDATTNTSFSKVPIQFLVEIVSTPVCPLKPIITSTLPKCTPIQVGVQFNFTLTITSGCSGTTIKDVFTMPPLYMYKGNITRVGTTNVWTMVETWTPDSLQLGSQAYCALATDSANIQSDQYCTTFTVVSNGTVLLCPGETTTSTTTTTTSVTTITTVTTSTSSTTKTTTSSSTSTTSITTMSSTSTTKTTSSTSTSSTSTSTSTTTVSTRTTSTSTTSVTTSTVTTTTIRISMTSKNKLKEYEPLIIALSILGFLALLSLCCCCCWWYLYGGLGNQRRRHRKTEETEHHRSIVWHPLRYKNSSVSFISSRPLSTSIEDRRSNMSIISDTHSSSSKILDRKSSPMYDPDQPLQKPSTVNTVRISHVHRPSLINVNEIIQDEHEKTNETSTNDPVNNSMTKPTPRSSIVSIRHIDIAKSKRASLTSISKANQFVSSTVERSSISAGVSVIRMKRSNLPSCSSHNSNGKVFKLS
ncbi:hypothetical protein I4U23_011462 [Adineta vaga]|nr:hypothetical protein I4U23_011462 [Adineta vaga]